MRLPLLMLQVATMTKYVTMSFGSAETELASVAPRNRWQFVHGHLTQILFSFVSANIQILFSLMNYGYEPDREEKICHTPIIVLIIVNMLVCYYERKM